MTEKNLSASLTVVRQMADAAQYSQPEIPDCPRQNLTLTFINPNFKNNPKAADALGEEELK